MVKFETIEYKLPSQIKSVDVVSTKMALSFNTDPKSKDLLVLFNGEYKYRRPYKISEEREIRFFYQIQVVDLRWRRRGLGERVRRSLEVSKDSGESLNKYLFDKVVLSVEYLSDLRVILLMEDEALILSLDKKSQKRIRSVKFSCGLLGCFDKIQKLGGCYYFFRFEKSTGEGASRERVDAKECFYLRKDCLLSKTGCKGGVNPGRRVDKDLKKQKGWSEGIGSSDEGQLRKRSKRKRKKKRNRKREGQGSGC